MATTEPRVKTGRFPAQRNLAPFFSRLRDWILERVWYVHAPFHLTVNIPPSLAFQILSTAAKPSTERLHLRNVFASGRRYMLYSISNLDFMMTTSSKIAWRYSRRTSATAIMLGTFTPDSQLTRIELHSRIRVSYLLDVVLIPTFMTSLIISMPWEALFTITAIILLYGFSWFGHRYNAALEAYEMLFFVEKALEDYIAPAPLALPDQSAQIVPERVRDFAVAWDKFYETVVTPDLQDKE